MWLPGTYHNGFAPRDGVPRYQQLWQGCVGAWNPGLGPTGSVVRDNVRRQNLGRYGSTSLSDTYVIARGVPSMHFTPANNDILYSDTGAGALDVTGIITVSAWIRKTTSLISGYVACKRDAGTYAWGMYSKDASALSYPTIPDAIAIFGGSSGGYLEIDAQQSLSINVWHHVGAVFAGANSRIYYNGKKVREGTIRNVDSQPTAPMCIGARLNTSPASSSHFAGQITDVMVYSGDKSHILPMLARRPGIAYELAPRRMAGETSAAAAFQNQLLMLGVG